MPRVSLGLPVFNGERFLAQAIDSILSQTFTDFELIITDNASTDATREIAELYSRSDDRIRYLRNPANIGAGPNFDRAFAESTGEYFKWVAHDDLHHPEFLERTVAILDERADAVVAYTKVDVIDDQGNTIEGYDFEVRGDGDSPEERLRWQIRGHQCYEIFGLIRRDALVHPSLSGRSLMGEHFAGDAVLLIRLGLIGKLVELPQVLFYSRRHETQSESMRNDVQSYSEWFSPESSGRIVFPYWRVFAEYVRSILNAPLSTAQRFRCSRSVIWWFAARRKLLMRDAIRGLTTMLHRLRRLSTSGPATE